MSYIKDYNEEIINILRKRIDRRGKFSPNDENHPEMLSKQRDYFLQKWGPDKLSALKGKEVLERIFGSKEYDSLTYWLEMKHDKEFNTLVFGTIWGGYSSNFILSQYSKLLEKNTQYTWTSLLFKKNASEEYNRYVGIPDEYAIEIATVIRDAILRGVEEIDKLANNKITYEELANNLQKISDTYLSRIPDHIKPYLISIDNLFSKNWIHKYFHILHPEHISNLHSTKAQQTNMAHVLLLPPTANIYLNDGLMRTLMQKLDFSSFLEVIPWDRSLNFNYPYLKLSKSSPSIAKQLNNILNNGILIWEEKVFNYLTKLKNTIVYITDEHENLLAYGKVITPYTHESKSIEVDIIIRDTKIPITSQTVGEPIKSFRGHKLYRYAEEIISVEKAVLPYLEGTKKVMSLSNVAPQPTPALLPDDVKAVWNILQRKKQIILYGPPGTGKTYMAKRIAEHVIAKRNFSTTPEHVAPEDMHTYLEFVTFHPSYSYDDFVEGIKVDVGENGEIRYSVKDGLLKAMANRAEKDPDHIYILIIDEINRGDTARIFGELITLIENDKRGKLRARLPLSKETFTMPKNLYIIGTMNTSDRSIALVDAALRRRFAFIRMWPDYNIIRKWIEGIPLHTLLKTINARLIKEMGEEGNDLIIGHSFFMRDGEPISDIEELTEIIQYEIIPLLEEYLRGDVSGVISILGSELVNNDGSLKPISIDDFIVALKNIMPDVDEDIPDEDEESDEDDSEDQESDL